MKPVLRILFWCGLCILPAGALRAAEPRDFTAVRRADAARLEATIAGDASRLAAVLSDELSYGYSDGRVQTKAQLLTAVATNRVHFQACDYLDTHLLEIVPGAITMGGLAQIRVETDGQVGEFRLRFLAVWRQEEDGRWRLAGYQSAPVAAPAVPAGAK